MTREKAKELLPLMQAYSEGKVIQYQNNRGEWEDMESPDFACDAIYYRVKSEETYRPYRDCDEMIADFMRRSDIQVMPSIWIKHKITKNILLIIGFEKTSCSVVCANDLLLDFEELFNNFTYLDDTICGVKE
jgi:hypothetical protein